MKIDNAQSLDPVGTSAPFAAVFNGFAAQAAVAAQSSLIQLFNPALSPANVQVIGVFVSLATAGDVVLSTYGTQLTTLAMGGQATSLSNGTSNAAVRNSTAAAIPGTQIARYSLPANQSINIVQPWEMFLIPARGLVVAAVTVNIAMTVTFRWVESYG